jgi:hypothetical protein
MLSAFKITFNLRLKRETSLKPLLYLAIYIKAKRFYIKTQIIFLFLKAII